MDYLTEVIAQKYDRPSLVREWQAGRKRPLLLFYGHKSPGDGSIGPQVLSQWQRTSFSWRGVSYFCMEQFMMEAKARLFRDPYRQGLILKSKDPQEIKRLGRQIENFRGELWDRQKFTIVYFGNYLKFSQNSALGDYLVSTSPKVLAEASPYDAIWGIDGEGDSSVIAEHIRRIRAKLAAAGAQKQYIETVWGVGYKWAK